MPPIGSLSSQSPLTGLQAQTTQLPTPPHADATSEAFQAFVGETFFGMMLKALRETSGEVAYFDGGQAEEMFRGQLDQTVSERLAETHGETIARPMYDRFRSQLNNLNAG